MVSRKNCPICDQMNGCAVSRGKPVERCWCMKSAQTEDKNSILLPIPKEAVSCYCEPCLEKIKKELGSGQSPVG